MAGHFRQFQEICRGTFLKKISPHRVNIVVLIEIKTTELYHPKMMGRHTKAN
jgi:hypothetical protein